MQGKILNFKDLRVWKEAHFLVLSVYALTRKFPSDEKFSLVDQTRRSAISVTSNIAEGFGRNTSKDKLQFYSISKGSLFELESQLLIAKDLGYLQSVEMEKMSDQISTVSKMLSGLMRSAPARIL